MDILSSRDFRQLAELADESCVSLLMPTHTTGRETKQDPIRLKNLVSNAEEQLVARGRRPADARAQLEPLRELIDDKAFWAYQREGLAAFSLPDETRKFAVPHTLPEHAVVDNRCYLVPLIPAVNENRHFFVLALSPKNVRLLSGTRDTAAEMELPGWPADFAELAAFIDEEPQLQFHTGTAPEGKGGARRAMFHGQSGELSAEHQQRLLEFCRLIDDRVQKALGNHDSPLLLACEERLGATYREAASDTRLVQATITGNPDAQSPAELCSKAWEVLKPEAEGAREGALARYRQAAGSGLAASSLDAVLPAAYQGRIDTLIVADDDNCWGRYDPIAEELSVHGEAAPEDEELINRASVVAYLRGARVYAMPRERLPENELAVAVLRG